MQNPARLCIACNAVLERRSDEYPSRFAIRRTCNSTCARRASVAARTRPLAERFWEKVDVRGPNECWPWKAGIHPQGYGTFSFEGRLHIASRIAWILTRGPIPGKLQVLHHCDNPPCCNPDCLFLGTVADNMRDRDLKGRRTPLRGTANPLAKLTDAQVAELRELYAAGAGSQRTLAERFGIAQVHVGRIVRGESRVHTGS